MKRKGSNAEGSQVSVGETVSRTRCATILYYHLPKFSVSHLIFRRSAEMFNWSWRCATAEHSSDGLKINVQLLLILQTPTPYWSNVQTEDQSKVLLPRRIRMALFHLRYWISTSWVIIFPSLPVSFYSRRDPLTAEYLILLGLFLALWVYYQNLSLFWAGQVNCLWYYKNPRSYHLIIRVVAEGCSGCWHSSYSVGCVCSGVAAKYLIRALFSNFGREETYNSFYIQSCYLEVNVL